MAYLARFRKEVLVRVAREMGEQVSENETVIAIKKKIIDSVEYEEETVKELVESIKEQIEHESEEREKREQLEREEREKREQIERESEQRKFELEKLKLGHETRSRDSLTSSNGNSKVQIHQVMDKFKGEDEEITSFLSVFEAQAVQLGIAEEEWVTSLMGLLPNKVNSWLMLETAGVRDDYETVKGKLLEMFKFNAEKFRQMFVSHYKQARTTWNVYARELRNYCKEWISGLNITTFEALVELIVTDQMKKRVPAEMRNHFVDEWGTIANSMELARKLDSFENNRAGWRWTGSKNAQNVSESFTKQWEKPKVPLGRGEQPAANSTQERPVDFERQKKLSCFVCGSLDHLKRSCPKRRTEKIQHLASTGVKDLFRPHTCEGRVNGKQIKILRDTGASFDLISEKFITDHNLTGESVWIFQPLDTKPRNLPVAEIELEGPFGCVITQAAVVKREVELEYYLLSNRTATRINEIKEGYLEPQAICAVTRAAAAAAAAATEPATEWEGAEAEEGPGTMGEAAETTDGEHNEGQVPNPISETPEIDEAVTPLLQVNKETFAKEQREDEQLGPIIETIQNGKQGPEGCFLKGDLLFKVRQSKRGERYEMLVVPKLFRGAVLKLCHETANAHLGTTKSKDSLAKYFFWPNYFKEMEDFIRSCDSCQRVGRAGDIKRAPLKIVPVVAEVFSKINVDACGPFKESESGRKYILTAMCLASRYPEAIPIKDLTSTTVISALLELFSRIGFPKELQTDQGTCFTSVLTAEFANQFGIKLTHSSPYHPQTNAVERLHRSMNRILKVMCLEADTDWETKLPAILFALRTTVHESLGFTPAELVFGRNLRTPITLLYDKLTGTEEQETPVVEYVFKLVNRIRKCKELADEKLVKEQEKRKQWYDRRAIRRTFEIGEQVLVLAPHKTHKLAVQWRGPGKITEHISDTNYAVLLPDKKEAKIYHVNMLKKYYQRVEYINFVGKTSKTVSDDDEIDRYALNLEEEGFDVDSMLEGTEVVPEFRRSLETLLIKYKHIFSEKPGLTDVTEIDIEITDYSKTIRSSPYRMSPRQTAILRDEITKMLRDNIIEVGESDYTSPMILVEAQGKKPRPCIDYRRLNKIIKTEYYPLPNMDERIETVAAAKIISTLDLAKCYWQVPLTERAQRYAAFVTSFGTFRPLRLPFGIKNGPYHCSRMMAGLLRGCHEFCLPYLDDIAVFSESWQEHVRHLDIVFKILEKAKLHVQPAKCNFARSSVHYLGFIVGNGLMKPTQAKIHAIKEFPVPQTKKQVRAFLGLTGYYRKFIAGFSEKAAPLSDLLRGKERQGRVSWSEACETAFIQLRDALCSDSVLHAPDFQKQFIMQTDASKRGIGVILAQKDEDGNEHPVLYISRKFSEVESRYGTSEQECLGIVWGVQKLKYYLDGQVKLKIETDHNPLTWLQNSAGNNARLLRWSLILQQYDIEIFHKKGKDNINVDALSRMY